ncbi:MAG: hypothetical protein P8N69_07500 [Flavobacteriales bacterium]|nr:hypothetical protein [Flavobacteriales bacterium]
MYTHLTGFGQFNDTLSLKYKDSKILIISKSNEIDEWSFEEDQIEVEKSNHSFRINSSFGILKLNDNYLFNGFNSSNRLPYNNVNSSMTNFKLYFKSIKIKAELLKIFIGIGVQKNKLNLGGSTVSVLNDSLMFSKVNIESVNKNNLNLHYLTLPFNISWVPFSKRKKNLLLQLEFSNQILWYGKSNFKYVENNIKYSENIKNNFFNSRYYLSGSLKIIYRKIGVFMQSNLTKYNTIFPELSNYSFGLTICL